ncbi:MAG: 30S ribosomal protein S20 [Lentisphaerae bacterium]|jgi:small subunit ribosomal protein S20|nr:30S ribosomal protein S20 [Lentisphaerota bacterium]
MAKIKSAEKRARQAEASRKANRAVKSKISTVRRKAFETVVQGADAGDVAKVVAEYSSTLDKAAKRGIIKRNTADRRKARMAKRVAAAAAAK